MLTLPSLLSAGIWIVGLAGALATLSYADWFRHLPRWRWSSMMTLPRLLAPLCLSFTLFCSGMALAAVTNASPSWWQIAAWSILAVIFAFYAALTARAGKRNGWDTPFKGMRQP